MLTAPPDQRPAPGPESAEAITAELVVEGMHCAACASRIERALAKTPSVASAAVNLATGRACVSYDPLRTSVHELCQAVDALGYPAAPAGTGLARPSTPSEHWVARAFVSWPLALVALALSLWGPSDAAAGWAVLVLAVAVEFGGGWPFLRNAGRQARHGAATMDTLIAVGTLAALSVNVVETVALGGNHIHVGGGFAAAARLHGAMAPLIVAILVTGRAVEAGARRRATETMHSLLSLRPPTARLVRDADDPVGRLVSPESVPVGSLLRVKPGEAFPLDGSVLVGHSAVDQSMVTGEPFPVDRGPGDPVVGGTRNGHGHLVIRTDTVAADSTLARLQKMVDDAQRDKAHLQLVADRVSAVFVPSVLVGALVTFLAWWLVGGNAGTALLSAIAVLLVACPCAMGLATPVAMMVGSGRAAAMGIFVRSADALERLAGTRRAMFDKTGTLTDRRAAVSGVVALRGKDPHAVLELAAGVEAGSDHPIAVAISAASDGTARAERVVERPGAGVVGLVDGTEVRVGRLDPADVPAEVETDVAGWAARGDTVLGIWQDAALIGAAAVAMPLHPEAAGAVARLQQMGVSVGVLSGDGTAAVRHVARRIGVDEFEGDLSPQRKVDLLRQGDVEHTLMVGDGINDAPALAAAGIGCAIGSGSEIAVATADVTLVGTDLRGVPTAVAVARSTQAVVLENLGWAMGYNVAALPLAACGLLDPLVAAIAMGLSSLVVIANSLRLSRLGRLGPAGLGAPRGSTRRRAHLVAVLVPIALFASLTLALESVSPDRGQPLLPALPTIVTVALHGGGDAQVYLEPDRPGLDQLHVLLQRPALSSAGPVLQVRLHHDGTTSRPRSQTLVTAGHYLDSVVLSAGDWTLSFRLRFGDRVDSFSVRTGVS